MPNDTEELARLEKYDRQKLFEEIGWEQKKIAEANVTVIGSGRISDYIIADLFGLGVANVTRVGESNYFEFDKMTPVSENFAQIDRELANPRSIDSVAYGADFVIDATNSRKQKKLMLEYCIDNDIPMFSASATRNSFLFYENHSELEDKVLDGEQGELNSMVCAAMVVDELRKKLFLLEGDLKSAGYFYEGIDDVSRPLVGKKIVLVGAGGTGTFAGLGLVSQGVNLAVIDDDTVEESNLNRQIMYYESKGKSKARVLSERLSDLKNCFSAIKGMKTRVDEKFNLTGNWDVILSCVDNHSTRVLLNRLANKTKIPLLNCGIDTYGFNGGVQSYIPGKTACIDCQSNGSISAEHKRENAGHCTGSLVVPNQIVGALSVHALKKLMSREPRIIDYSSGQGIKIEKPYSECLESCELHGK